jgi:hypothetical protein
MLDIAEIRFMFGFHHFLHGILDQIPQRCLDILRRFDVVGFDEFLLLGLVHKL